MHSLNMFDFSLDSPQNWTNVLNKIKQNGNLHIKSSIYWGVHEQLMGIRDFSKSPVLKLEKYFNLIQNLGLTLELFVPLSISSHSFPSWTFEQNSPSLVGSFLLGKTELTLYEIPSLYNFRILSGFIDFLKELGEICSLYIYPDGPIKSINIDLRAFKIDLNAVISKDFSSFLNERYKNIEEFNSIYGTYFKSFNDVSTSSGLKLILNRRPWLATFDYRFCRERMYKKLVETVLNGISNKNFIKVVEESFEKSAIYGKSSYFFDGIFIDSFNNYYFPCIPCGYYTETSIVTYRCWESGLSKTNKFSLLNTEDMTLPDSKMIFVSCGPYFYSKNMEIIKDYIKRGGWAFFSNGLPLYDEKMQLFTWPLAKTKSIMFQDKFKIDCFRLGEGLVLRSNLKFGKDMCDILELNTLIQSII